MARTSSVCMGSTLDRSRFFSALFPACQLTSLASKQNRLQNWWIINSCASSNPPAGPWLSDQLKTWQKQAKELWIKPKKFRNSQVHLTVNSQIINFLITLKCIFENFEITTLSWLASFPVFLLKEDRYIWCWDVKTVNNFHFLLHCCK